MQIFGRLPMDAPLESVIRNLHRWNEKHGKPCDYRMLRNKACPGFHHYKGKVFISIKPSSQAGTLERGPYHLAVAGEYRQLVELLDKVCGPYYGRSREETDAMNRRMPEWRELRSSFNSVIVWGDLKVRHDLLDEDAAFMVYSRVKAVEELHGEVDSTSIHEWLVKLTNYASNQLPIQDAVMYKDDDDYGDDYEMSQTEHKRSVAEISSSKCVNPPKPKEPKTE